MSARKYKADRDFTFARVGYDPTDGLPEEGELLGFTATIVDGVAHGTMTGHAGWLGAIRELCGGSAPESREAFLKCVEIVAEWRGDGWAEVDGAA